jgi:hypothetical protein
MRKIIECMDGVDLARRTPPGSPQRIKLANSLAACSKAMMIFARRPWGPAIASKILRQRAADLNGAIQDLAYPALLGTDRDLGIIKNALGEMTYMLSLNNWVGIIAVMPPGDRHGRPRRLKLSTALPVFNFTFVAMAAVPAIPLIVEVFKYMGL